MTLYQANEMIARIRFPSSVGFGDPSVLTTQGAMHEMPAQHTPGENLKFYICLNDTLIAKTQSNMNLP